MLTVKKILAGRGAVDYYLNQTRRGLADYYVPEESATERDGAVRLSAPGSAWWGRGSDALELSGAVERAEFVPLYAKGVRSGGGYLGRRFRLPEEAAAAKADALRAAAEITAIPSQLLVQRLEQAAQAHREWRRAATDAQAIRRQVALEKEQRQRRLALLRRR